jgi:hypothetical protein
MDIKKDCLCGHFHDGDVCDDCSCQIYQAQRPTSKPLASTPGPWKYHLGRGASPRFHIQTEGGYQIASTTELVRHSQAVEENSAREANARLIAAAPELLLVAKEFLDLMEIKGMDPEYREHVRAIIAKAEGHAGEPEVRQ